MLYYAAKVLLSALVIVAVSEVAKRHSGFAALIAALPLTSLLAFVWLHLEAAGEARIAELSQQIFWLVIPSLVFFVLLPILLRNGLNFWWSLLGAAGATVGVYLLALPVLRKFGLSL